MEGGFCSGKDDLQSCTLETEQVLYWESVSRPGRTQVQSIVNILIAKSVEMAAIFNQVHP